MAGTSFFFFKKFRSRLLAKHERIRQTESGPTRSNISPVLQDENTGRKGNKGSSNIDAPVQPAVSGLEQEECAVVVVEVHQVAGQESFLETIGTDGSQPVQSLVEVV